MSKIYLIILLHFLFAWGAAGQIHQKKSWNLSAGADLIYPEKNFRKTHG